MRILLAATAVAATVAAAKNYATQRAALLEAIGQRVTFDSLREVARAEEPRQAAAAAAAPAAAAPQQQPAAAEAAPSSAVQSLAELAHLLPPATVVEIAQSLGLTPRQIAHVFNLKPDSPSAPAPAPAFDTQVLFDSDYESPQAFSTPPSVAALSASAPAPPPNASFDSFKRLKYPQFAPAPQLTPPQLVPHGFTPPHSQPSESSPLSNECEMMQLAMEETVRQRFPNKSPDAVRAMVARMDVERSCAETLFQQERGAEREVERQRLDRLSPQQVLPRVSERRSEEIESAESVLARLLQMFPPEKFLQAIVGRGLEALGPGAKKPRSAGPPKASGGSLTDEVTNDDDDLLTSGLSSTNTASADEANGPPSLSGSGGEGVVAPAPAAGNSKKKKGDFFISFGGSWDKDMFKDKSAARKPSPAIDPLALLAALPKGKKHRSHAADNFASLVPQQQPQPLLVAALPMFAPTIPLPPPPPLPPPLPPPPQQIIKNPIDIIEYIDVASSPTSSGVSSKAVPCSTGNCVRVRYDDGWPSAGKVV